MDWGEKRTESMRERCVKWSETELLFEETWCMGMLAVVMSFPVQLEEKYTNSAKDDGEKQTFSQHAFGRFS